MNDDLVGKIIQSAIDDDDEFEARHQKRMQMIADLGKANQSIENVLLFGAAVGIVLGVVIWVFAFIGLVGHIGG